MKHPTTEPFPQSNRLWRVRLFDGPILQSLSGEEIRHFRSRKVGALLAYLAMRLGHPCPREELFFAIWPEEEDMRTVANRLRVALASLRRQMEPPGIPFGTVLDVSQAGRICLREETAWCDVVAFERLFKSKQKEEAASLLKGSLLPGYYEDWVLLERERLDTLSEQLADVSIPTPTSPEASVPTTRREIASANAYPLPLYLTRYFGREAEQRQLLHLLCERRLVTLTGPGGMGKTRLAVETVQRMKLPAVFVSLAEVTEGENILRAILHALSVLPSVETELIEQLLAILRRREELLLILDNAEYLLASVSSLALRLLEAIPGLTLLVTSRERLNISGETVLPLTPLEAPPLQASYDTLVDAPAVALFLDRARNARPDFVLSARYTEAMQQICLLLEGVPLALELAAARVVMQTPAQIVESLESGLLLLQSQQHGFPSRHRSLRASIQGSYDLLSPELQTFFAALSVFQGGWTAEAARFVTGCPETDAYLEELMRRSLLVIEEHEAEGVIRGTFLESIRQFAAELLTSAARDGYAQRHADYFLTLAGEVTEDDIHSLLPLDLEQDNLLAALETGWNSQTALFYKGLVGALYYAYIRGHNRTFLLWTERSLTIMGALPDIRDRVRLGIAQYLILGYMGRYDHVRNIGEAMLRESNAEPFPSGRAVAKIILSYVSNEYGEYEAMRRMTEEALIEARQANDETLLYRILRLAAWLKLTLTEKMPGLDENAILCLQRECEALSLESLSILPPYSSQITFTQTILASVNLLQGKTEEGYKYLKSAQKTAIAHGMNAMLIFCYRKECEIAIEQSAFEYAALLYGAYRALREKTGYTALNSTPRGEPVLDSLMDSLGYDRFEELALWGEQAPLNEIAALSLSAFPSFPRT